MNAPPSVVIPISIAEAARFNEFYAAESIADATGRPLASEMIEVVSYERDQLQRSMMAANQVYAAPFHPATMRRYVVLRYTIDLIERVAEHKAQVAPILFPELAPKRRRA